MTLDECYNTYKGTVTLVDGNPADAGQCVQWADVVLAHVYGFVTHYGNAIDWWNDPKELIPEGFVKVNDGTVKKGDFVVFNTLVGSVYGHIDVAMTDGSYSGFTGADSNWGGNKTVHLVGHDNPDYVLGVLRLKGGNMSDLGALADLRLAEANKTRQAVYLATTTATNSENDIRGRVTLVKGDVDNLLKDVGITPTQADYNALEAGPKEFVYYLQSRLKPLIQSGDSTVLKPGIYQVI